MPLNCNDIFLASSSPIFLTCKVKFPSWQPFGAFLSKIVVSSFGDFSMTVALPLPSCSSILHPSSQPYELIPSIISFSGSQLAIVIL